MRFINKHKIKQGVIEFKKILQLIHKKVLSNYQMVSTFLNKDDVIEKHKIIGLQYYTKPEIEGEDLASIRITSLFKMIFSKRFFKNIKIMLKNVKIIQRYWRNSLLIKRTRALMLENINSKLKKHDSLQK